MSKTFKCPHCHQIVDLGDEPPMRLKVKSGEFQGMTHQAKAVLEELGYKTKADVIKAIQDGSLSRRTRMIGARIWTQLMRLVNEP